MEGRKIPYLTPTNRNKDKSPSQTIRNKTKLLRKPFVIKQNSYANQNEWREISLLTSGNEDKSPTPTNKKVPYFSHAN